MSISYLHRLKLLLFSQREIHIVHSNHSVIPILLIPLKSSNNETPQLIRQLYALHHKQISYFASEIEQELVSDKDDGDDGDGNDGQLIEGISLNSMNSTYIGLNSDKIPLLLQMKPYKDNLNKLAILSSHITESLEIKQIQNKNYYIFTLILKFSAVISMLIATNVLWLDTRLQNHKIEVIQSKK